MYNDEKNLYHYTYRKDGSEQSGENLVNPQSVPGSDNEHRENVQEMKPVKKNRFPRSVPHAVLLRFYFVFTAILAFFHVPC